MTIPSDVLKRDDIKKILAIDIDSPSGTTYRFTNSRSLRDGSGNIYSSRLRHDYSMTETTGAKSSSNSSSGTGIGGTTSPNVFTFTLDGSTDGDGNNLDSLRNQIKGSVVTVRLGADFDSSGNKIGFSEFEEKFYGNVSSFRKSNDTWTVECVSREAYRMSDKVVRESYRGIGYGIALDNTSESESPVDAWLTGTSGSAFVTTSGKYTWSSIISLSYDLPSDGGIDFNILSVGNRIEAWIRSADDNLEISHHNGTSSTSVVFSSYTFSANETPIQIGVRYDGTDAHLYINSILVESQSISTLPADDATTFDIGRSGSATKPLSAILYEIWLSGNDVGDAGLRARHGPLLYDFDSQQDLFMLHKFLEGGEISLPSVTSDLVFNVDLTLGGTAAFTNSEEGDDPNVDDTAFGKTKPFIVGKVFNIPPVLLNKANNQHEYSTHTATIRKARVNGSPLQIGYSDTGTYAMAKTPLNAFENATIASLVFAKDDSIGRAGSQIEVSGGHSNDGIYTVTGITGKRWVEVTPDFSVTDRSASVTINIPETSFDADIEDLSNGKITSVSLDGKITVDAISTLHPSPGIESSYIFFRNAKSRVASEVVADATFTDNIDVTWVGENGEKDLPWSISINYGEDITYDQMLKQLLDTYFAWSSDTPRVDVSGEPPPVLEEGVRMGHYRVPAAGGTSYRSDIVEEATIGEPDVVHPAWRLTVTCQPNYSVLGNDIPYGVLPGERERLKRESTSILINEDRSIKDNNPDAQDLVWQTNFFNCEDAALVGQRVWDFFNTQKTWRSFKMNARPEDFQIGEDITIPHSRFDGEGTDTYFFVATKKHNITDRGVEVITIG